MPDQTEGAPAPAAMPPRISIRRDLFQGLLNLIGAAPTPVPYAEVAGLMAEVHKDIRPDPPEGGTDEGLPID